MLDQKLDQKLSIAYASTSPASVPDLSYVEKEAGNGKVYYSLCPALLARTDLMGRPPNKWAEGLSWASHYQVLNTQYCFPCTMPHYEPEEKPCHANKCGPPFQECSRPRL